MQYHVIHIETDFEEEWEKDIFDDTLAQMGVDTIDGGEYYLPSDIWVQNADEISRYCRETKGVKMVSATPCPDADWNATWEAEHPIQELPLGVRIVPHCAFGAGHHETTSMMIDGLLSSDLDGKRVCDHGTGTGVLGIFAKKVGAEYVLAIDIDEKSVLNAQENAELNGVGIEVREGSSIPVEEVKEEGSFDLILANIHRNVLLDNMARYADCLANNGALWISGFYEEDCPILIQSAKENGLRLESRHSNGEWRMLRFRKVL